MAGVDTAEITVCSLKIYFPRQKFKLNEWNLKSPIQKSNEKHVVDSPDGRISPSG